MFVKFVFIIFFILNTHSLALDNQTVKECPRSNMDSIPIASQVKSLYQAIKGDPICAKATQELFVRTSPVFSQITSLVQWIGGDKEEAKRTQQMFLRTLEGIADSTPLIGHVKGGYHLSIGETERGQRIIKDSSRKLAVLGGGAAGGFAAGPPGAVAGGVAGGVAYDGLVTGIDSAVNGQFTAYGSVDSVHKIVNGKDIEGEVIETLGGVVGDGFSGFSRSGSFTKMTINSKSGSKRRRKRLSLYFSEIRHSNKQV